MPIRLYDIAKKLGIDNRQVLAKARELGITAARAAREIQVHFMRLSINSPRYVG